MLNSWRFPCQCPQAKHITIDAKLDTCAQSCLWSLRDCLVAGFRREDLIPVSFSLSAANKSRIEIAGALLLHLKCISPIW